MEVKYIKDKSINSYLKELTNDYTTDYFVWKEIKKISRSNMQILHFKKRWYLA